MSDARLARFTLVLEERGIVVAPLVAVAQAVGLGNVFLGVGTLSGLAGGLGVQDARGVEAVFDQSGTDLVVWLKLGS